MLERQAPQPIPSIHPVPEYLADDRLKPRYEEMKSVFQVPWMGVVTMAYAHYRAFYDTLWQGTRELCASTPFVEGFLGLRELVEDKVAALDPPPITGRLEEAGYAPGEIENIREIVEVFSHGNFPYVVLAAITRMLLEGGEMSGETAAPKYTGRHAPDVQVPFLLMERHHAQPDLQGVYDDVMTTLQLPFVNTDYRAFARWPSYFAMAWSDLKPFVGTEGHEAVAQAAHDRAVELARTLPNPGGITPEGLQSAAEADASLAEVHHMSTLFQWLLPGLVTNVAFFRHQLRG